MVCRKSASAIVLILSAHLLAAAPLPEQDRLVHEGVASCASSICHGRVEVDPQSRVWLTEYRVWLREDPHAQAYKTLLSDDSVRIAQNLGLPNAHEADVCLACHADKVPESLRGAKFHIEDGVGCEACHGGSENYLKSHTEKGRSYAMNVEQGLYPTASLSDNTALCVSCHLGTRDKFATHEIMGAGHPRLTFELLAYSINQPMHYSIDDDYRARKPVFDDVTTWLSGLSGQSRAYLELLKVSDESSVPGNDDFALYHCHACHRPMQPHQWQQDSKFASAVGAGALRLNDGAISVLISVLEVLSPADAELALAYLNDLHRASSQSKKEKNAHIAFLNSLFAKFEGSLNDKQWDSGELTQLMLHLVRASSQGQYLYYAQAEQVFLAVETLAITLGVSEKMEPDMNRWYGTMLNQDRFSKSQFASAATQVLRAL
jgi:hypothetical protein